MTRTDLVDQAVVESARIFMAAHLRHERAEVRGDDVGASVSVLDADAALQDLRDALAAQSKTRRE